MKTCLRCGREFPETDRYFHRIKATGQLHGLCKSCQFKPGTYVAPLGYKHCPKCDKDYPATNEYWVKSKKTIDGFVGHCKNCIKQWRDENSDVFKQYGAEYRETHRDKARETTQEWRENNRDRDRENSNNWRKRNPERAQLRSRRHDAKKRELPIDFTNDDWIKAVNHFGGKCAVCERFPGLWRKLSADHWIPLVSPDCPGTVPHNMIPLCHGIDGCNNSKNEADPLEWLIRKFGKQKGKRKFDDIQDYLNKAKR